MRTSVAVTGPARSRTPWRVVTPSVRLMLLNSTLTGVPSPLRTWRPPHRPPSVRYGQPWTRRLCLRAAWMWCCRQAGGALGGLGRWILWQLGSGCHHMTWQKPGSNYPGSGKPRRRTRGRQCLGGEGWSLSGAPSVSVHPCHLMCVSDALRGAAHHRGGMQYMPPAWVAVHALRRVGCVPVTCARRSPCRAPVLRSEWRSCAPGASCPSRCGSPWMTCRTRARG